ncbi:hypothetical protein VFPFJ_05079 [Purpureocillium lilacinum]|uniref:Uncharacterized protein n=1 Tax=Purpureocillium lilacinum TaxID=33203 RepID=A0A179HN90_PURLI|nr:hypothetical protein VFPFJ_05079 [Purpureocillium lilacinum]OAQ90920.1 hypothetical protein VFPFJ_05079 [Purpureocillium lilacinum]
MRGAARQEKVFRRRRSGPAAERNHPLRIRSVSPLSGRAARPAHHPPPPSASRLLSRMVCVCVSSEPRSSYPKVRQACGEAGPGRQNVAPRPRARARNPGYTARIGLFSPCGGGAPARSTHGTDLGSTPSRDVTAGGQLVGLLAVSEGVVVSKLKSSWSLLWVSRGTRFGMLGGVQADESTATSLPFRVSGAAAQPEPFVVEHTRALERRDHMPRRHSNGAALFF